VYILYYYIISKLSAQILSRICHENHLIRMCVHISLACVGVHFLCAIAFVSLYFCRCGYRLDTPLHMNKHTKKTERTQSELPGNFSLSRLHAAADHTRKHQITTTGCCVRPFNTVVCVCVAWCACVVLGRTWR